MLLILLTVLATFGAVIGGLGSFMYWRETHSDRTKVKAEIRIQNALHPFDVRIHDLEASDAHLAETVKAAMHETLGPVRDQLAVLNTKIEPLWTALINMGINQTNVLHQPDPRRAEVDGLMEKLQEELRGGHLMSAKDFARTRHFLELIKTYEPGQELGFPVLPAEPTSAAILLAIMGLSRQRRQQE